MGSHENQLEKIPWKPELTLINWMLVINSWGFSCSCGCCCCGGCGSGSCCCGTGRNKKKIIYCPFHSMLRQDLNKKSKARELKFLKI